MRGAIAGSATLSRSTSSSHPLFSSFSCHPHHARTHARITRALRPTRASTSKPPLSGITQTSLPPPTGASSFTFSTFVSRVCTHVGAGLRVCPRVRVSRCTTFCVYAEPTIHSRIRLASTGFAAKAYIHGRNKRQTKMALPPKNCEENRGEFFTGVDLPPRCPAAVLRPRAASRR